jgi:HK97 gp10 family phage protein
MMRIRGEAALQAKLRKVEADVRNAAPEAGEAGAEPVAAEMAQRAPVDRGDLRSSIGIARTSEGAIVGPDAPHARFVQGGTVNMSAQPFMTDAARAAAGEVPRRMAEVFRSAIRRGI